MKNKLQNLLKHKLQWLMLLAALLGVSQGAWANFDARKTWYFDNSNTEWEDVYIIIGRDNWTQAVKLTTTDCNGYYVHSETGWDNVYELFFADSNCGYSTGSGSAKNVDTDRSGNYTANVRSLPSNIVCSPNSSSGTSIGITWNSYSTLNCVLNGSKIMFYIGEQKNWNQSTFYLTKNSAIVATTNSSETVTYDNKIYGIVTATASTGYYVTHDGSLSYPGHEISGTPVQGGAYWNSDNSTCTAAVSDAKTATVTLGSSSITEGSNVSYSSTKSEGSLGLTSSIKFYATTDNSSFTELSTSGSNLVTSGLSTGTYTIWPVYYDGHVYCRGTSASLTVTSACSTPTAYTFAVKSGSVLNLCSSSTYGATSTTLKLANSQTGYTYQLYKDNTAEGSPVDGTDNTAIEWKNISSAGKYKVIGYVSGDESCSTQMDGTPTVTVYTAPSYSGITESQSVCQGSAHTISLTSPANATTYQWEQGSTDVGTNSSSYSISSMTSDDAGTYTCKMTNTGCTTPVVTSGSVVTYVATPTPGTATAGGSSSTTVMYNGSTTIAVTGYTDGSEISWEMSIDGGTNWSSASHTTASFTASSITTATMYRATITKSGCSAVTNEVTVNLTYRIRVKKNKILSNNAYIHIWDSGTCNTTWESCPAMTASDDGQWWYYDCSCNPVKILFKDATGNVTNNNHQTNDIDRSSSSSVFCYEITSNYTDNSKKQDVVEADCCNTPTASGFTMSPTSVTYDGTSKSVTVSPNSGYGAVSDIKYNGSSTAPTNVGDYTVTADIAAEGDWCAVNDLEIGTFSIIKRSQAALSITTSTENRCTGVLPLQLAVSGGSTSGTVTYAETVHEGTVAVSSSGEITASTNASITVIATMAGDDTYNDVVSDPVTFTFTQSRVIYLKGSGAGGASATYPWEYMTIEVDRSSGKTTPSDLTVEFIETPDFSGGVAPNHSVTITDDNKYLLKSAKTVNDAHYYTVKAQDVSGGTCAASDASYNVYINSAPAEKCGGE